MGCPWCSRHPFLGTIDRDGGDVLHYVCVARPAAARLLQQVGRLVFYGSMLHEGAFLLARRRPFDFAEKQKRRSHGPGSR